MQIEGVLAHAGLPDCFPTKGARSHKGHKGIGRLKRSGALPHALAGEGRFRTLENGERRTENGAPLRGDGWGRVKTELPNL